MNVEYIVKCPDCSARAVAQMHVVGRKGTYREVLTKLGARRVVCHACGCARNVPAEKSDAYALWYSTTFKGHRLWAVNRIHLAFLMSWLSGEIREGDLGVGDRAMVEAFPKWMVLRKNRAGILRCLKKMIDRDIKKTVR